jgi:GNAT superfamily N-acetyltransferase
MGDVRAATIDDAEVLARVAAAGFYDDPVMRWVMPDDTARLAQLTFVFGGLVRDMLPVGGTVHVNDGASAAFWRAPDYEHGRTAADRVDSAEAGAALASRFSPDELTRLGILGESMMAAHPHEPHWYLNVVSTLPERQGEGLGAAVLQPVLATCDAEGVSAYLESSNPRNMTLYRRLGFVETGEIQLPDGPSLYQMWRDPQG